MPRQAVVLLAEDDRASRLVMSETLTRRGFQVRATGNASTLWHWIETGVGDIVVSDVVLPDADGLDLLPRIRQARPLLNVIVVSARNTAMAAIRAAENGAFAFLAKPFDLDQLVQAVSRALDGPAPAPAADPELRAVTSAMPVLPVGRAPAMAAVLDRLRRLAEVPHPVAVVGETGTGRSLLAGLLHRLGPRRADDCIAIPLAGTTPEKLAHLLEGPVGGLTRSGVGTVVLDGLDDLLPEAQPVLLGAIERYLALPAERQCRLVSIALSDPMTAATQGQLRQALAGRLSAMVVTVPPLRDRADDLEPLVAAFVSRSGRADLALDPAALQVLAGWHWPGNVRELENMVSRLALLYGPGRVSREDVEREMPSNDSPAGGPSAAQSPREGLSVSVERHLATYFAAHRDNLPPPGLHERVLREVERPLIALTLSATAGNQLRAAEVLGINRNTLRKKIRELDIVVVRGGGSA